MHSLLAPVSSSNRPPVDCTTRNVPRKSLTLDAFADLGEISPHARSNKGIGHHGRAAFELAIFLREFMRHGDEDAGNRCCKNRFGAQLMGRIAIAVQKQHGDCFDLFLRQNVGERQQLGFIERCMHAAVGKQTLGDFVAVAARHQGRMFLEEQIVGVRAIDPADLVDVAEPRVVTSAVLAPVRSSMVLMATVEPCRKRPVSEKCVPALATLASMPSTMACGVDRLLPSSKRLLASSNAATSVNVPPISAASRRRGFANFASAGDTRRSV